jgi:hypothetical protein
VRFHLDQGEKLKPIAIGFNKVLFQKQPAGTDLNASFASKFKRIPTQKSVLWSHEVNYFTSSFLPFVDLAKSTEHSLVLKEETAVLASFSPQVLRLEARPKQVVKLPVTVENRSEAPFPHGRATFGLSYHLLSHRGEPLKFDNARSYLTEPGTYLLEIDLVWESMWWAKEKGNPTCTVQLIVRLD